MKSIIQILFVSLLISSCDKNQTIVYPLNYNFKEISYIPSKFYVLDASLNLKEIVASGNFLEYDSSLRETATDFFTTDDNIKEIKLEDEDTAIISYFDGTSQTISYTLNNDLLTLIVDAANQETIDLKTTSVNGDIDKINLPFCVHLYSYKQNGEQEYTPFEVNYCNSTDLKSIASTIAKDNKLKTNDTLAVSICQLVYEKK